MVKLPFFKKKQTAIVPKHEGLDKHQWLNRGKTRLANGKFADAIQCFNAALKLDPNFKEALAEIAVAHFRNGRAFAASGALENAIGCYKSALKINPRYIDAWYELGAVYEAMQEMRSAIKYYQKAVELAQAQKNQEYFDKATSALERTKRAKKGGIMIIPRSPIKEVGHAKRREK